MFWEVDFFSSLNFFIYLFFGTDCVIARQLTAVTWTPWKLSRPHLTLAEIQWHGALEIIDSDFLE